VTPHAAAGSLNSCLDELARIARSNPEAAAIFSPGNDPLTFSELDDRVESVAHDLRALGVERGDVVAVAMPEGRELLMTLLGIMRVAVAAPFDASFTDAEFRTRLTLTPARCLVTAAGSRAARALALPVVEVRSDRQRGPVLSPEIPGSLAFPEPKCRRVPFDTQLILQTSATTAAPKLVPLTRRNLSAICNSIRRGLGLRSSDVYLSVLPLHHILGFSCAVGQLLEGGGVACPGAFDPLHFASWLAQFQPTWYAGGPALHHAALQIAREHPEPFAPSLRFIRCGTGAASPALLDELEHTLKVTVVNGYGLTEVGSVTNTDPHLPRKKGSVGRSIGLDIAIMASSGSLLPPNNEGEVVVRGDAVTPGYLGDPAATHRALRGGWFHTGDLGRVDQEGDLFITGRIKEIINRGGEIIVPIEIDHALADHPAVAQAAAFSVDHPTLGEDAGVAIVLRPGAIVTEAEIRGFLADGRLSRARIPNRIVFTDSIPVSATGKPLRKMLSEKFGASIAESSPAETLTPTERRIAESWASLLGISGIPGRADNFFQLGGDSLSAARMIAAVDKQFDLRGRLWERAEFFDSPTVAALADILALFKAGPDRAPGAAAEKGVEGMSAVFLQALGSSAPIVFFPGDRMNPWYLRHLVKHLGEKRPFIVLLHELTCADQFDIFASRAVTLIQKIRSSGPVVLAGHCYGGILAYEVAQRLVAAGRSRIPVVLIDTPAPGYPKLRLRRYLQYVPAAIRILVRSGAHPFAREIAAHIRILRTRRLTTLPGNRLPASFAQATLNPGEQRAISPSPALTPAGIVLRTYEPKPFSGPLACLNAGDAEVSERVLDDPRLGWRDLSRGLYISRTVAGRHDSIFDADNAPELAQQFRSLLRTLL
jgi:acyl-CoA synthetase (AMP-forming)/AMP-acid ligase II/thioesterase domain-containing protein/acyl carrier protein